MAYSNKQDGQGPCPQGAYLEGKDSKQVNRTMSEDSVSTMKNKIRWTDGNWWKYILFYKWWAWKQHLSMDKSALGRGKSKYKCPDVGTAWHITSES